MNDIPNQTDLEAPVGSASTESGDLGAPGAAGLVEPAVHIWTIQVAKWRQAKREGIAFLDTTAKSGRPEFAPDWDKVMAHKNDQISDEDYTKAYTEKMRKSLHDNPDKWEVLDHHPRIAVACFCPYGSFCHRNMFTRFMIAYLNKKGVATQYHGDLH